MLVYGATGARLSSGKNTERTIAVSYNPTTNTWRTLPRAPLPGVGYDALAAWTGHEVIIGGGDSHANAAAYNPTTNRWRRLPAAPEDFTGNEGADSTPTCGPAAKSSPSTTATPMVAHCYSTPPPAPGPSAPQRQSPAAPTRR